MNDKEATMMQPDKMSKDDVGLEIGEGYLMMGLKIDMPVDGRTIAMVHTVDGSEVELVSMPAPPVVASLSSPTES